ncbi:MAG TPA: hypothetical protein VKV03_18375 [Candidatus Binataceae bacterium]|nr:hypothetical protein [Candidatus Binataceae bacterium]
MKFVLRVLLALAMVVAIAGCTPDKAMDFGPTGEINTTPDDQLSRDILRDFDGRDFELGQNDREAVVRLTDWPEDKHVIIPFWLGINPLMPYFHRPQVGRIYVMSESVMVRALAPNRYLIRAGSKAFKNDAIFEATHTHYDGEGKMLPTVVRFVGTVVATLPLDPPRTGTITEKVPVLREVSLPMHLAAMRRGYANFTVTQVPTAPNSNPGY